MSSFYDDASLVVIPSGYKTSKVYAEKPTDGSGDLAFTRTGDTATRVNSAGLIEKVRTNLITYSEQLDNAAWTKGAVTATSNSTTAPNGTTTADTITETATTAQHQFFNSFTTSASIATYSIYLKANGRNFATVYPQGTSMAGYATVDLSNGTINTTGGSTFLRAAIESAGNGWYRVSVALTTTANSLVCVVYLSNSLGGVSPSYAGDGTSGIYVWGAQLETGDIATDYIPTTTAAVSVGPVSNVPRLDYLGSSCPRLLLEPQRTNLWTNSESFSGGSESIVTYTANSSDTLDPAGYNGADKFAVTTSGGDAHTRITRSLAVQAFSVSVYVKGAAGQKVQLFLARDGYTEIKGTSNYTLNGSWQRLTFSDTFSTTSSTVVLGIEFGFTSSDSVAGQLYYVWGAQVEAGAYATSYIPTLAATATRGADACSKTGISSLIGQTEGTLFVESELSHSSSSNQYLIQVSASSADRIFIYREANTNKLGCFVRIGSTTIYTQLTAGAITGTVKAAFAYKSGSLAFYVNGTQVALGTSTFSTPPSMGIFDIDSNSGLENGYFNYNQALLFKTRLSNAQLAELTTL